MEHVPWALTMLCASSLGRVIIPVLYVRCKCTIAAAAYFPGTADYNPALNCTTRFNSHAIAVFHE